MTGNWTAQLKKKCSKNVFLMFPLRYENIISECSLNVQSIQFLNVLKTLFLGYTNVTLEQLNIPFHNFANIMGI